METVNLQDIKNKEKLFFHFTRTNNLPKIEKEGLRSVHDERENVISLDLEKPCIYFSSTMEGLLKTIDVWIRWELGNIQKLKWPTGKKFVNKEALLETYEKIHKDFNDRTYLQLDLVEGEELETSDFSFDSNDYKKELILGHRLTPYDMWLLGPYTDWSSAILEDWNMQTHIGNKTITPEKLKKILDSNGNSDALSIVKEIYNYNKSKGKNLQINDLDRFMDYLDTKKRTDSQQLSPVSFLDKIKNFFRRKKYQHIDLPKKTRAIYDEFKDAKRRYIKYENNEENQKNEDFEDTSVSFKEKLKHIKNNYNNENSSKTSKDSRSSIEIEDSINSKSIESSDKNLDNDFNHEI